MKDSISCRTTFSPNPHLVKELTCFPFFAPWYGLNWTTYPYVPATRTQISYSSWIAIYSLPTAMNSVTGNHLSDLFYLLKENFKNLLFDSLIMGRSFEKLSYLSSCSLSQRWRFREHARTYYEALNQTFLKQKFMWSSPNTFYGLLA